MLYYVYLARCKDNSLYTGYTINLEKREKRHNDGTGARYTRVRRPISIVYYETFESKSAAMKREYQVKQLKKSDKEKLVGNSNLI